ncbi:MAG: ABC transporter ATPase [Bacteroidota bacterium]
MLSIKEMPSDARVWVYQSNKALSDTEVAGVAKAGNTFIADWAAHGASLKASFDILHNRFIVLAVDEKQATASGCSIDKSVHFIKELEKQFNLNLFDRMQVAFRKENQIITCHFNDLLKELTSQISSDLDVLGNVTVFNNMVASKAEFDTNWECKLKNSWQGRVLPVKQNSI